MDRDEDVDRALGNDLCDVVSICNAGEYVDVCVDGETLLDMDFFDEIWWSVAILFTPVSSMSSLFSAGDLS